MVHASEKKLAVLPSLTKTYKFCNFAKTYSVDKKKRPKLDVK